MTSNGTSNWTPNGTPDRPSRLVIIGDVLLDRDIRGRISRHAEDGQVPVLGVRETDERPGGAGLTALLAERAGADVILVAPIATDAAGERVRAQLEEKVKLVALPTTGATPVKTRVQAAGQSMVRIDEGGPCPPQAGLTEAVTAALAEADAVLVSDYGQGVTADPELRACLESVARRLPVVWDPHREGSPPVPGAAVITPNEEEAAGFAGVERTGGTDSRLFTVRGMADRLLEQWAAGTVAVTLGSKGALLANGSGAPLLVPSYRTVEGDACGAGDCLAAVTALAVGTGAKPTEAIIEGVRRATEYVADGAVAGLSSPAGHPAEGDGSVWRRIAQLREDGKTLVATGGCFDILHPGHVSMLRHARSLGDCLIVLLNSDDSVRRLKGPSRPINPEWHRKEVLQSLGVVDAVLLFTEDSPADTLERLRPDVWVKGGDYVEDDLPEASVVRGHGGEVVLVPYLDGYSTTGLIQAAQKRSSERDSA